MRKKEKAASVLQHQDGGEQTRLDGFDELLEKHFSTAFEAEQGSIAALLPHSRETALTSRELARITDQAPREITRRICAERRGSADFERSRRGLLARGRCRGTAAMHRAASSAGWTDPQDGLRSGKMRGKTGGGGDLTPIKSIRAKCVDCCCGSTQEVRLCPAQSCPLWPYRMGRRPTTPGSGEAAETPDVAADFFELNEECDEVS